MTRATDDLDRTIRDFHRLRKRIAAGSRGGARAPRARGGRRRLIGRVAAVAVAVLVLCVLVPPFRYPVRGTVTSRYFVRRKPDAIVPVALEMHDGLDIAAPLGSRVLAAAPGVVTAVGSDASSGNHVRVRHLFGVSTFYAHLADVRVRAGDVLLLRSVRALGTVGSTGRSTGPHLHFELGLGGTSVPSSPFLLFHAVRTRIFGG